MTIVVVYTGTIPLDAAGRHVLEQQLAPAAAARLRRRREPARDSALWAYAALEALREQVFPGRALSLAFSPAGKPYFQGPAAPGCSLSHTAGALAVGVSEESLGLDIQARTPYRPAVARRCLSAMAQQTLSAAHPADRDRLFTAFWAKKEAALKRSGRGLAGLREPEDSAGCYTCRETEQWALAVCAAEPAAITVAPLADLARHWGIGGEPNAGGAANGLHRLGCP